MVIATAKKELGYYEKKTNAMLESKTSNIGDNNYTKYGKAMGCNGYPWCDAFVDWCFVKTFGKEMATKMLYGLSNYTPQSAQNFKKNKAYTNKPSIGCAIFFKNSKRICHTGIVTDIVGNMIYTIEGNTSAGPNVIANGGSVCLKSYIITNPRIDGYGIPNYGLVGMVSKAKDTAKKVVEKIANPTPKSPKMDEKKVYELLKNTIEFKNIKTKCGLTDNTMMFLCKHNNAPVLLKKINKALK